MTGACSDIMRAPHAALDIDGRRPKAEKIRSLLPIGVLPGGRMRLLEIGTGSGAIASHFASLDAPAFDVDAVDVVDQRRTTVGYRFHQVGDAVLPFESATFDVVISNHVLEHVGDLPQQSRHLKEIARVLAPGGVAYLASPNRWQVVEPHFHVPLLSWWPRWMRSPYLSLWRRRRQVYDCEPLNLRTIERLMADAGLLYRNACVEALRSLLVHEGAASISAKLARRLPDGLLWRLRFISPTHVYLMHREADS